MIKLRVPPVLAVETEETLGPNWQKAAHYLAGFVLINAVAGSWLSAADEEPTYLYRLITRSDTRSTTIRYD
jgi:hypothetical protein